MQRQYIYMPLKYAHYPLFSFLDAFLLYLTEHPNIPTKPKRRVLQAYETYLEYTRAYYLYWQSVMYNGSSLQMNNDTMVVNNPLLSAVNKYVDVYFQAPPVFSFNYQLPQFDSSDYTHWRNPFIVSQQILQNIPRYKLAEIQLADKNEFITIEAVLMRATINAELFITAESYQQSVDYMQWLTQIFGYPQRYIVLRDLCMLLPIVLPKELNDYLLEVTDSGNLDSLLKNFSITGYKIQEDKYSLPLGEKELLYISYPLSTAMIRMDNPSANNQLMPGQDFPSYGISAPFEFRISYPVGVILSTRTKVERLIVGLGLHSELRLKDNKQMQDLYKKEDEEVLKSTEVYRAVEDETNKVNVKPLQKIERTKSYEFITDIDYIPLKLQPLNLQRNKIGFIAEIPDKIIRAYTSKTIQVDTEIYASSTDILQELNSNLDVRLITFDTNRKTVTEKQIKSAEVVLIDADTMQNAEAKYKIFIKFKMPRVNKKTKTKEYRILIKLSAS